MWLRWDALFLQDVSPGRALMQVNVVQHSEPGMALFFFVDINISTVQKRRRVCVTVKVVPLSGKLLKERNPNKKLFFEARLRLTFHPFPSPPQFPHIELSLLTWVETNQMKEQEIENKDDDKGVVRSRKARRDFRSAFRAHFQMARIS